MDVFGQCKKIKSKRITTSQYDEGGLQNAKMLLTMLHSIRNDHPEYLSTPPEWMKDANVGRRKHRVG